MSATAPTTTATGKAPVARAGAGGPPARPRPRLQVRWLALFALAVLAGAALTLWALGRAAERVSVLVVRAPVGAGQTIPADALGVADVAADDPSLAFVPASQRAQVEGQTAARALLAGSPLTPGDLSDAPAVAAGERTVGAVLVPGRFPASVRPGDRVLALSSTSTDAPALDVRLLAAEVRADKLDVVMVAAADQAPLLARWAAADDLVLVGEGGR